MNAVPTPWLSGGLAVAAALLLVVGLVVFLRRRQSLEALLGRIAWAQLKDVVIPDDVDGEIHLDLALLTTRGILVLEVRRAAGTLFWGEQLERWTVLDGARRKVIENPLPGLQARRHAVHALAPRVPVDGRVLLVGPVRISGDNPPGVLLPAELLAEFPVRGKTPPPDTLREAWATLRAASRPI